MIDQGLIIDTSYHCKTILYCLSIDDDWSVIISIFYSKIFGTLEMGQFKTYTSNQKPSLIYFFKEGFNKNTLTNTKRPTIVVFQPRQVKKINSVIQFSISINYQKQTKTKTKKCIPILSYILGNTLYMTYLSVMPFMLIRYISIS